MNWYNRTPIDKEEFIFNFIEAELEDFHLSKTDKKLLLRIRNEADMLIYLLMSDKYSGYDRNKIINMWNEYVEGVHYV